MKTLPFFILDVFAETKYAGNQLAVFPEAGGLSDATMQTISREINFSETTFIRSGTPCDGGYDVRIYTPAREVPFAGHPTLGTAFILQQEIIGRPVERVILNLKIGQIPVELSYGAKTPEKLWMQQIQPVFGAILDADPVSRMLGIDKDALDERFPIQEVSTGLPTVIVPLKTLDSVRRIRPSIEKYYRLIENQTAKAIYVFCPETYQSENDLNCRMFGDYYGVPEDPATGSAAGCLAGYLARHRYFGSDLIDVRLEQGYEINRPSLLLLKADVQNDRIDIRVGGKVIMIARGEFL